MTAMTLDSPSATVDQVAGDSPAAQLYLDLLKKSLTDWIGVDRPYGNVSPYDPAREGADWRRSVLVWLDGQLRKRKILLMKDYNASGSLAERRERRENGRDWPGNAESMIGNKRMDNIQYCVETVLREDIPGDLIETGVFRGGATILMRAILKVWGDTARTVWVADSFEGLPKVTDKSHTLDKADPHDHYEFLKISLETVQENFAKYGLLDGQVKFLKGWFADTLPKAPIGEIAVLRLDGDMYSSTMDAISVLYPKLSPGGFCIVDDYGAVAGCKQAITDYREKHGITEPIEVIDWGGVYWRRSR